jgi:signal transduction histidine kinase
MDYQGESDENISSPIIKCDENRVMQVLLGLQSNALKFTEKGKVHIKVEIINGYLQISVIDTGIGIPKENQGKLFKLFGFLQDDKQLNVNGIGLGLMISK